MEIVPVPRNDLSGVWSPGLFHPEVPISSLTKISDNQVKALEGAGIYSIGEFLQVGTRVRAQACLEALLGAERTQLVVWAQQASLMLLRGVNGLVALALIDAGYGSFNALAVAAPESVVTAYARIRESNLPDVPEIDVALVTLWIRASRQYLGLGESTQS